MSHLDHERLRRQAPVRREPAAGPTEPQLAKIAAQLQALGRGPLVNPPRTKREASRVIEALEKRRSRERSVRRPA